MNMHDVPSATNSDLRPLTVALVVYACCATMYRTDGAKRTLSAFKKIILADTHDRHNKLDPERFMYL
jgi:hypothetical protein